MRRLKKQKKRLTGVEENLICVLTIIGAGIGPYLLAWIGVKINGPFMFIIREHMARIIFLLPPSVSILIVFGLTRNLTKTIISAVLATILSISLLIYLGYRIPP